MKHVLPALGVAASTLVLCAACTGSSTPSSAAGGTASAGQSGSGAATSAAPATPLAAGGTSAAAKSTSNGNGGGATATATGNNGGGGSGTGTCSPRYLNATISGEQGTAGSVYVNIVFKNLNNQACTMDGYPGVSFGAGTPVTQVGQPAARNPQVNPSLVTLQPGGYAYAILQIGDAGNWSPTTCQPTATTYLQIYPPNTQNQLYAAYDSTGCKGDVVTLHVEAVQPGTGS